MSLESRYQALLKKGELRVKEQKTPSGGIIPPRNASLPTKLPPGVKPGDQMRAPTTAEIDDLLRVLPEPICRVEEIRVGLMEKQRTILRGMFENSQFFPQALPYLKEALRVRGLKAMITPGTAFGLWVSDDMGASVMQGTLNTRHKPGARSNASGGIKSQTEINKLTDRSNPVVILAFKEPQTFASIMEIWRPRLVGLKLRSLVYHEEDVVVEEAKDEPEWYSRFPDLPKLSKGEYTHRVVFKLRRDHFFSYRLRMKTIRERLEKIKLPTDMKDLEPFRVVHNSVTDGEILLHIIPVDANVPLQPGVNKSLYIIGKLGKLWREATITGKDGITGVLPIMKKTMDAVYYEKPNAWRDGAGNSYSALYLHEYVRNQYNIGREQVRSLLLACGFLPTHIKYDSTNINIVYVRFGQFNVSTYIKKRTNPDIAIPAFVVMDSATDALVNVITTEEKSVAAADELVRVLDSVKLKYKRESSIFTVDIPKRTVKGEVDAWLAYDASERLAKEERIRSERLLNEGKLLTLIYPPTELETAAIVYFAEVSGATFQQFFLEEGVDINRTYSNNAKEMNTMLGIEAARNFLTIEIEETWNNSGSPLQPTSILTCTDAMTYRGSLTPSSHAGITSVSIGYLSKTTVHAATKWFAKAAVNTEKDHIQSVSAAVMVGKRIKLGTGIVKVRSTAKKGNRPDLIEEDETGEGMMNPQYVNDDTPDYED